MKLSDAMLLDRARMALRRHDSQRAAQLLRRYLAQHRRDGRARRTVEQAIRQHPTLREMLGDLLDDERPTLPMVAKSTDAHPSSRPSTNERQQPAHDASVQRFLQSRGRRTGEVDPLFYGLVAGDGPPLRRRD